MEKQQFPVVSLVPVGFGPGRQTVSGSFGSAAELKDDKKKRLAFFLLMVFPPKTVSYGVLLG